MQLSYLKENEQSVQLKLKKMLIVEYINQASILFVFSKRF